MRNTSWRSLLEGRSETWSRRAKNCSGQSSSIAASSRKPSRSCAVACGSAPATLVRSSASATSESPSSSLALPIRRPGRRSAASGSDGLLRREGGPVGGPLAGGTTLVPSRTTLVPFARFQREQDNCCRRRREWFGPPGLWRLPRCDKPRVRPIAVTSRPPPVNGGIESPSRT